MYVCGQKKLLERIDKLIDNNLFPRFIILVGNRGCGKKVLSDYIARKLEANFVPCGTKADEVKDVIFNSYTVSEKTLYMFFDCDDMSVNAKNALLKVTEEPPNNSYFVMTVTDLSTVLETLISRGTVFNTEPYTIDDLKEFIEYKKYEFTENEKKIIYQICTCPEEVINAKDNNVKEVYDLADKFIQFIGSANMANELKIATMLNLKKDQTDKIDPVVFLRCIMLCCNSYLYDSSKDDVKIFDSIIKETSKALVDLSKKSFSKQMVIDNWIISTHLKVSGGEF